MNALDHRQKPPREYEQLPPSQQEKNKECVVELVEEIAKPRALTMKVGENIGRAQDVCKNNN